MVDSELSILHTALAAPNDPLDPMGVPINMEVENEKDGVAIVSAFADFNDSIQILINRKDVFWNDTSTGGHTLFFGIEKLNFFYAKKMYFFSYNKQYLFI